MSFVPLNGLFAHDGVRMPHSPVGESSLSRSMRSGTPPPMMAELISTAKIEVEISGEGCRRTYDRRSKGWNDTLIRELQTMLHSGWYDRQTYRFDTEINNTLCSENAVQKSEGEIHSKCVQSGTLRYESSQLGRIAEDEMPQTCMWIDLQNTNDTRVLRSKEQLPIGTTSNKTCIPPYSATTGQAVKSGDEIPKSIPLTITPPNIKI